MSESARVVVITGGSRGLGAGLVRAFLERGDTVATCSRAATDEVADWQAEHGDRFMYGQADVANRADCDRFISDVIDRYHQIDVLVNNAGIAREGVLGIFQDEDIDAVVDLNLKGTIYMTRVVARRMLRRGTGSIINISSVVGLSGYRGLSVYGATKAALDGFTRALARELGPRGITVNSIAPGYLRTEMSHGLDEAQLGQIVRRTPAGRLGEPADIAAAAAFLSSPAGSFITGHVLVVDGGLTA